MQRTQNDCYLNINIPCNKSGHLVNFKDPANDTPLKVYPDCSRSSKNNKEQLDFKVK